jgi:hypothetical protein
MAAIRSGESDTVTLRVREFELSRGRPALFRPLRAAWPRAVVFAIPKDILPGGALMANCLERAVLATTSPVIAQVWRNGSRQALMARLVAATRIDAPDEAAARRAGELLARTRTVDVVDGLLVALVRPGDSVVTSDPGDIKKLLAAAASTAAVVLI